MATMNVSLPDQMKTWVESQTDTGRYSNASDYVRDLIRRDQIRNEQIGELQALIDEGFNSGGAVPFDFEEFKQEMHLKHGR